MGYSGLRAGGAGVGDASIGAGAYGLRGFRG